MDNTTTYDMEERLAELTERMNELECTLSQMLDYAEESRAEIIKETDSDTYSLGHKAMMMADIDGFTREIADLDILLSIVRGEDK